MTNKYNCDAYDSGYCCLLRRPLTDEEDDLCEDSCCYILAKDCSCNKEEKYD